MVEHLAIVMSYLVAQSTRDIGVRIPLPGGAAGNDTRRDRDCGWIDWCNRADPSDVKPSVRGLGAGRRDVLRGGGASGSSGVCGVRDSGAESDQGGPGCGAVGAVAVTAHAVALDFDNSAIPQVITQRQIKDLPLNGANLPSTTSGFPILPNEDLAWDHFPGDVFLG